MSRRTLLRHATSLLLLPLTMAQAHPALQPADLMCQFKADVDAAGQVSLHFTLRNAGRHDLHLLRWGSPFEGGWFGRFVQASTPQGELPFQGALRKRGDPSAQDYLLLRAGQSLDAELSLADAYALPVGAGPLHLKAGWHWHDVIVGSSPRPPRQRARHQGLDQDCGDITLNR
ncbi:MAG: hypothetical protein HY020_21990 [Burkholderiales bacterium]|nr:hypothetical protein [Burkholderiales bacterium]